MFSSNYFRVAVVTGTIKGVLTILYVVPLVNCFVLPFNMLGFFALPMINGFLATDPTKLSEKDSKDLLMVALKASGIYTAITLVFSIAYHILSILMSMLMMGALSSGSSDQDIEGLLGFSAVTGVMGLIIGIITAVLAGMGFGMVGWVMRVVFTGQTNSTSSANTQKKEIIREV